MRSFGRKVANSKVGIYIRNLTGFRVVNMSVYGIDGGVSVSDAFCWRTDNGYTTTFKYSDILKLFYGIDNSYVQLVFYSKDNNFLKEVLVHELDHSNELLIDKEFIGGLEDYGVFYIFHRFDKEIQEQPILSNRCYLGFSRNGSLCSFVHGNVLARYQDFGGLRQKTDLVKSTLFKNQIYRVQNVIGSFDKSELFLANPTSKPLRLTISNTTYRIKEGCSILVDVGDSQSIRIKSNCLFLRPIVFNYIDEYFDVYHG